MGLPSWIHRVVPVQKALRPAKLHRRRVQPRLELLEDRCLLSATTYTVNSLLDTNTGSGDAGTLRYVINQANTTNTGTAVSPDLIQFTVSGAIGVTAALPTLTDVANIEAPTVSGVPTITLDGTNAGAGATGLTIGGGSSTVQGLDIINFAGNGIQLGTLVGSNGNDQVQSCYIGLTTAGVAAANGQNGILIEGSSGNTIGSTTTGNVISGNGGDGILIDGPNASLNTVVANFIGTNAAGSAALGNAGNGIEITNGANRNLIGGNTPTATAFTGKPIDGNVISGNGGDGVLLTGSAEFNTLSGNFIGTNLTGLQAVGNTGDGVGIVDANNNSLIGTTFPQAPFVYLNLVCGNGGNGLVIDNSNNTTVQANSFGLADNNATALGNHLDGVLIDGTSTNTQFGGVIPLGNIVSGNDGNGIELAGTASGTVIFNTFCGLPAFVDAAVGNALDGILITSTGGNNLLRTNVISGNVGNGIHISGNASGVQVAEDIIGMDTNGALPLGNGGDGILIDNTAHDNLIGGTQVSVILQNTISSNGGNGIAIVGSAFNNQVFHSFIGTNIEGLASSGNAGAGILIGGTAQNNTIGGTGLFDQNVISGNLGGGIQLSGGSQGTLVIGNLIGTDRNGQQALGNHGDGIGIASSGNQVGGAAAGMGNVIAFNTQDGVGVASGTGNAILGNSIFSNAALGIRLVGGGNLNQPAPVLSAAEQLTASTIQITGTLTASANTTYTLEFFDSSSSTPPGQGQNFLGSLHVVTNANGVATFGVSYSLSVPAGTSFTATTTDSANNTSAFSNVVFAATPVSPPAPTPTPVGRLTPFGFGFGPGLTLELLDVDSQGQVFAQTLGANLFTGAPTFVNGDLIFSNVQLLNGLVFGFLQEQGNPQELVEILNFANPFVFNAVLAAMMRPV
jgi:parallel beta-helix repeat protein